MNIFEQGKTLTIEPFYFKNIGDEIQGTYVGKRDADDHGVFEKDSYGHDLITYELQVQGGIKNVAFTATKKIHNDMTHVKFGQVIGFRYVKDGTFMLNGKPTSFKDVKVFADEKIVDTAWLKAHADGSNDSGLGINSQPVSKDDGYGAFGEKPVEEEAFLSEGSSVEAKLKAISELAKTKLGVIDPAKVKDAVMTATEMAFIPVNYFKIVQALTNL